MMPMKPTISSNVFRFYLGAVGTGMGCGVAWTTAVLRWVRSPYDYEVLYGFVGVMFALQIMHLYREHKRLKAIQAEIDYNWAELLEKYPDLKESPWDERMKPVTKEKKEWF